MIMKKNKIYFVSAAITALTLSACADHDEFSQADLQQAAQEVTDGQIQFGTYLGKTSTRAWDASVTENTAADGTTAGKYVGGVIKTLDLQKYAEFGVFAYQTGTANWSNGNNTFKPEFMYNQYIQAIWDGTTSFKRWEYDPVKYWPNGIDAANAANDPSKTATEASTQLLSFFAYAPYTTNTITAYTETTYGDYPAGTASDFFKTAAYGQTGKGGVFGMSGNNSTIDPWVNYYLNDASTDKGVDLLWGLRGQYNYAETNGTPNTTTVAAGDLGKSYNVDLTKQQVPEKVRFLFKHALAKIGGSTKNNNATGSTDPLQSGLSVVVDVDDNNSPVGETGVTGQKDYFASDFDNTKTLVTLKGIKIRDADTYADEAGSTISSDTKSNLNTSGWFDIATGEWKNTKYDASTGGATVSNFEVDNDTTSSKTVRVINSRIREVGVQNYDGSATISGGEKKMLASAGGAWDATKTIYPVGVLAKKATPVYSNEDNAGIMLIPGTADQTLYVTVDYFVRTADKQLAKGYSEVEQVITNAVQLKGLEANKYYSLLIHLGLTSVKFEAVVADWATTSNTIYDENGETTESGTAEEQSVWLPSNVVNSVSITTESGTTHKSAVIAGHQLSYTINLFGLKPSTSLTVSRTVSTGGTAATVSGTPTSDASGNATVTLNFTANNTSNEYVHTITISDGTTYADGTAKTTVVTITQSAGVLSFTPSAATIDATTETFTATLKNGGGADVTITGTPSAADQKSVSASSVSKSEATATASVGKNTYVGPRTWTLTNTQDGLTATTEVVQNAGALTMTLAAATGGTNDGIVESSTILSCTKAAITTTPTVTLKVSGEDPGSGTTTYTSNSAWLSVNPTTGALSADENKSGERTAIVTVLRKDSYGSATVTYTVKQASGL